MQQADKLPVKLAARMNDKNTAKTKTVGTPECRQTEQKTLPEISSKIAFETEKETQYRLQRPEEQFP